MISKIKKMLRSILLSHATAEEVAMGFALGVFIGFTPTLGIHTALAVGLAALLGKNKVAALLGVWTNNPITLVPQFYFAYRVGLLITGKKGGSHIKPEGLIDIFHAGSKILVPLSFGGVVCGIVAGCISYVVVKNTYPYLHKKKDQLTHYLRDKKNDLS